MKTQWVLNDDEKVKFLNARRRNKKIQVGPPRLKDPGVKSPRALWLISEADEVHLSSMVAVSGFFDTSKVNDMHNDLMREIIR